MGGFVSEEAFILHHDATRMLRRGSRRKLVEVVQERLESPEQSTDTFDSSNKKFFIGKKHKITFLEKFMNLICCKNFD